MIKSIHIFLMMMLFSFSASAITKETPLGGGASPVTFIENKGQWISDILYKATSTNISVCFLENGLSFTQFNKSKANAAADSILVWNMKFINPSPLTTVNGVKGNETKYSWLSGSDSEKWVIHPKEFLQIDYADLYPNIDLQFYGNGNSIKNDYIVHAGGNIKNIQAYYEGIQHLSINGNGELEVNTPWNKQLQKAPVAWQIINGNKIPVKIIYEITNDTTFGFNVVNGYDTRYDLIIDPLFQMVWCSYTNILGANNNINYCFSNAMDIAGNVYLTGMVDNTFPITPGAYSGPGNIQLEIFVAKFSSDGTTLLYWTYLPGNSSEHGTGIAADSLGRCYVTGVIDLNITGITNFPSTPNAYQPVHGGGSDAFLSVLNSTGSALLYSSFLGGTGGETGYGIALGTTGTAYITGSTSGQNYPVVNSTSFPTGSLDVFIAKFDINQSGANSLVYSARLGGGSFNNCEARSIAVNSAGNAFITGKIFSTGSPAYPVTPGAYSSVFNPGMDNAMSFVTKFSATTPVSLVYSTFLAPGIASAIAVDNLTQDAFIVGTTYTFAFPITAGALQPLHAGAGGTDAFAMRLNASGTALVYSTFLGGSNYETGTGVAVNSVGEAYAVGIAQDFFPTSAGAFQPNNAGAYDFFVVNINASGTGYACGGSTYVGGSNADYSGSFYDYPSPHVSIRDHGGNNDTICVSSTSHSQDFPTTPGVYGPVKVNGIADQPVFFKMTCLANAIAPVANFNSTIVSSCDSVLVNFTDVTTNNPTTWNWTFPGALPGSSSVQNPQGIYFPNSGLINVSLLVCNSSGCDSVTIPVQINATQPVLVNIGNDTTICNGNSVILSASNNFSSYQWQLNGSNISSASTFAATQQGQYSITVTDSSGCTGEDTLLVFVNNPQVSLGNDTVICYGNSVTLTAPSGFFYTWLWNGSNLNNSTSTNLSTQQGFYSVLITDTLGCSDSDTVLISINNPSISLGTDIILCNSDSVLLTVTSGFIQYQWQFNGNVLPVSTSSIYVSQQGTYILTATDSMGCNANDTILVTTDIVNLVLINDTSFCAGNSLIINAGTGFTTYQWQLNNIIVSNNNSINVLQSGNYILTVSNSNGCTATDNVVVTINDLPQIQTSGNTALCETQSTSLTASGAVIYSWTPVTYLTSPDSAATLCNPVSSIIYTVTGTDLNGCSNSAIVSVSVNEFPDAAFDFTLDYGCEGIELKTKNNSSDATTYQWSFGDGNISNKTNPVHYYTALQNQTIQLIAMNGNCNDTSTITNISFTIPEFNIIPNVFTPNGDGKNDCYQIQGIKIFSECFSINVFNRWGSLVYASDNANYCWDGKSDSGLDLTEGVYFYLISIKDEKFKGVIHLLR